MAALPQSACQGQFHEESGIWVWTSPLARSGERRPALFLDRDGVIIEDPGYLCRSAEMKMIPGAAELIADANRRQIPVVEITNQAGIGRGYYGWEEFLEVEQALAGELAHAGARIDGVFACPYHQDGVAPWAHPEHPARKPQPGMLLAAARLLGLDLARSWIVGDKWDDLQAGYRAGLRGGLHVLTGKGSRQREAVAGWHPENFELRLGSSLRDAAAILEVLRPHPY